MDPKQELDQLSHASHRLRVGDERLDELIAELDAGLAKLDVELDYMHPRPLTESERSDDAGKRVIELSYLCYRVVQGSPCLAVRTIKVLESKAALASVAPLRIVPLRHADISLRQAAIDVMGDLLRGITRQMESMADRLEDRCEAASAFVRAMESGSGSMMGGRGGPAGVGGRRAVGPSRATGRRAAVHPSYPQLRRRTEPPIRVTRAGH